MNDRQLKKEFNFFFQHMFDEKTSQKLINFYIEVHSKPGLISGSSSEEQTVKMIVTKCLDASGIEPWLRSPRRRHLLSQKLLLISYLRETSAGVHGIRKEVIGRKKAYWVIFIAGFMGCLSLLRGLIQKIRYGLS
jgi:hypothetical protein